jgi:Protein of unknown function (DUF2613)
MTALIWTEISIMVAVLVAGVVIGVLNRGMTRIIAPAAAYLAVGSLLGAAAIFGITLMIQQDTKPPLPGGDPSSSVLNRVEYGSRS